MGKKLKKLHRDKNIYVERYNKERLELSIEEEAEEEGGKVVVLDPFPLFP